MINRLKNRFSPRTIDTLRTGLPLVVAAVVGMSGNSWLAAAIGLTGMSAFWLPCLRRMKNVDIVVWAAFGLKLAVLAVGVPHIDMWMPYFLPAMLVVLAFGSLAAGHPFTLPFAREQSNPDMWENPHFLHVNRILTVVWGVVFAGMLFSVWYWQLPWQRWLGSFACFSAAWLFTKWFPQWYQRNIYLPAIGHEGGSS